MSKQLTKEYRYQLFRMTGVSLKQNEMTQILSVLASTISRELRRNSTPPKGVIQRTHISLHWSDANPKTKLVEEFLKLDFSPNSFQIGLSIGNF